MSVDSVTIPDEVRLNEQDLHRIFAFTPHPYLVLTPNLLIVGANDNYLSQTLTCRSEIVGRSIFDVFPDNPDTPEAKGVQHLKNSFELVLELRLPHHMALQRYDVRDADGRFAERHWKPINYPVLDEGKRITHLLHYVEDVTGSVVSANSQKTAARIDYLKKAQHCGKQASACRSPQMRATWMEMQEQYLRLASGYFGL